MRSPEVSVRSTYAASTERMRYRSAYDLAVIRTDTVESRALGPWTRPEWRGAAPRPVSRYDYALTQAGQPSPIEEFQRARAAEYMRESRDRIERGRGGRARSDARLKKNIYPLTLLEPGVYWYAFEYHDAPGRRQGVVVQELVRNGKLLGCVEIDEQGFFEFRYGLFFDDPLRCSLLEHRRGSID